MNSKILVRPADQQDYEQWSRLYYDYAGFYKAPMNGEIPGTLWGWIHDHDHEVNGLLAVSVGEDGAETACGLAHARRMPGPLRGTYAGFLTICLLIRRFVVVTLARNCLMCLPGTANNRAGRLFAGLPQTTITGLADSMTGCQTRPCGIPVKWTCSLDLVATLIPFPQAAPRPT